MIKPADLARLLADEKGFDKGESDNFVAAFFDVIAEAFKDEEQIKIKGLGTFKATMVKQRESVNVNTGERVVIDEHKKISFTPDKTMKDLINKPFSQFETVVIKDGVEFADDVPTGDDEAVQEDDVEVGGDAARSSVMSYYSKSAEETSVLSKPSEEVETKEGADECSPKAADLLPSAKEEMASVTDEKQETETESTTYGQETLELLIEEKDAPDTIKPIQDLPKVTEVKELSDGNAEERLKEGHAESSCPTFSSTTISEEIQPECNTDNQPELETMKERHKGSSFTKYLLMAFCGVFLFCIGYYVGQESNQLPAEEEETLTAKVAEVSGAAKDTIQKMRTGRADKNPATRHSRVEVVSELNLELEKANERIAYGAYKIIGIDTVVTARKGQTLDDISKAHLGPGSELYVKALNDGVTEPLDGKLVRIPRLISKKKLKAMNK